MGVYLHIGNHARLGPTPARCGALARHCSHVTFGTCARQATV
jgi:hypothetical protein